MTTEHETCERNGCDIPPGAERHLIYGAVWCAACADDPDQYDDPDDIYRQRDLGISVE